MYEHWFNKLIVIKFINITNNVFDLDPMNAE